MILTSGPAAGVVPPPPDPVPILDGAHSKTNPTKGDRDVHHGEPGKGPGVSSTSPFRSRASYSLAATRFSRLSDPGAGHRLACGMPRV